MRASDAKPAYTTSATPFVLRTLISWYQQDLDIEARLPLLSTFLGHVHPSDTYWYYEAAPQLLALAAQRLDDIWEQRP